MKTGKALLFLALASFSVMACSSVEAADTKTEVANPGAVTAAAKEVSRFEKCQQEAKDLVATQKCLTDEQAAVEKDLADTVAKALAAAKETDKDVPGYDVAKKLETANQSFKKYVTDQCAYEMAVYTNGTLAGAAMTACVTTLTKQRNELIGPDAYSPDAAQQ